MKIINLSRLKYILALLCWDLEIIINFSAYMYISFVCKYIFGSLHIWMIELYNWRFFFLIQGCVFYELIYFLLTHILEWFAYHVVLDLQKDIMVTQFKGIKKRKNPWEREPATPNLCGYIIHLSLVYTLVD